MIEVILDTETTGLSAEKDRIVEIACVELSNHIPTKNIFHTFLNPETKVSADAFSVHGYSDEFLSNKPKFKDVAKDFVNFIKDKKLIIHNADFDLGFLNNELRRLNIKPILKSDILDTLQIARSKFPGVGNSLDALCKRFKISIEAIASILILNLLHRASKLLPTPGNLDLAICRVSKISDFRIGFIFNLLNSLFKNPRSKSAL